METEQGLSRTYGRGGDDVGIPGAVGNFYVFDPIFPFNRLAKDMSIGTRASALPPIHRRLETHRYLDERTKRDITLRCVPRKYLSTPLARRLTNES